MKLILVLMRDLKLKIRFNFNELSGLLRPHNGGAGLCVIGEINWYSVRTQGCIDTSPMRYDCPPLGQGWGGSYSKTASLHLACFFFSIQIKQLHLFTLSNIPFQSIS